MVQFPHMFGFWVALSEGLWKKKDDLISSSGTSEEQSNSAAVLNHILDRLLAAAVPEYDFGVDYRPNVIYVSSSIPQDQHRILKLLDLMTLTRRVGHSTELITLVSRPHEHLAVKYKQLVIPLIPRLKARFQQYHAMDSPILDAFLRTLVGMYLQDLLGSPSRQPEAAAIKIDCRCEDCVNLNRFLRSDAATETFQAAQRRRSHMENQIRSLPHGVTSTRVARGSRYALQVTKRTEILAAGRWDVRVQKANEFLAIVGTPDELARIMGERYPDVQAALAGTKPYEMGNPTLVIPPAENATTATSSTIEATTSGVQAGPTVAGVKRKAEDDEDDVIDLTSD